MKERNKGIEKIVLQMPISPTHLYSQYVTLCDRSGHSIDTSPITEHRLLFDELVNY